MRVLFTSPVLGHPAIGGPKLRIENSIKALSKVCELDIISGDKCSIEEVEKSRLYFSKFSLEYKVLPDHKYSGRFSRYRRYIDGRLSRFLDMKTSRDAEYIINHIDRRKIDVLWFGFGNISYPLISHIKKKRPKLKIVCDTDSVWSRYILRELPHALGLRKYSIWHAGQKKIYEEKRLVNICNVTTAVSYVDQLYYRDVTAYKDRIHIFSNVIDLESYKSNPKPPENFKNPSVYLAGSYFSNTCPMVVATKWVLQEVMPKLLSVDPKMHLYIVGNGSDKYFAHLNNNNITATGRLESVLPYLCNTDVALVPLTFESGTRFKILEAGACNIPIVSTTLGAEGIPVINGEHILIADNADDFSDSIIKIINNKGLAGYLANNCKELVSKSFCIESLIVEAKNILEYLQHD